ncbi:MAG: response regulator [Verrucomicrobiaceae bacterium]|nr:response regulator [Verrucomicrobiaceae bacterium]
MTKETKAAILLVEPHQPTQMVVMMALEPDGYGVLAEKCITDAVTTARIVRFDAAICETRLPDGTGVDLCHQLTAIQPHLRVLHFTAVTTHGDRQIAEVCGHAVLQKPACMADLRNALKELLHTQ